METVETITDDQSLYHACQQTGSNAQTDAFEILWSHLYRIAFKMLHDRPGGDALAADCAQTALIKIHHNLSQCRNPMAFRSWAAQILRRVVIDELRRPEHRHRAPLPENDEHGPSTLNDDLLDTSNDLRTMLLHAIEHGPLSDRSRRVIRGRYFEEQPDEALASAESQRVGQQVLPSHIQVTRAKNLASLRRETVLLQRLREMIET